MNPKYKEAEIFLDQEETIEKTSKSKRIQRKIEYVEKNKGKTLQNNKNSQNLIGRVKKVEDKLDIIAQVAQDIWKLSIDSMGKIYCKP